MSETTTASTELLEKIFPEWTSEQLELALDVYGQGDLMKTVEALLNCYYDDESVEQGDEERKKQIVCKYFLQGRCLIRNCEYLHSRSDRSSICRYWLQGFCMRGQECAYLHELESVNMKPTPPPPKVESRANNRDVNLMVPIAPHRVPANPNSLSNKLKLDALVLEFSHVHAGRVKEVFEESGCLADVARKRLEEWFGKKGTGQIVPVIDGRSFGKSAPQKGKSKISEPEYDMPWISTGEVVNQVYSMSRAEAEEHSRLRNQYFRLATEAFIAGDRKTAKEMSIKGREHDRLASEYHQQAAEKIFQKRNDRLQKLMQGRHIVDVHGLHPNEAIGVLDERLQSLRSGDVIDVITGTGHHSFDGDAKLLPALQKHLSSNGWRYEEIRVGARGGALRVYAK